LIHQFQQTIPRGNFRERLLLLDPFYTRNVAIGLETLGANCIANRIVMRAAVTVILAAHCIVQSTAAPRKAKAQDAP
jgi:hypothetical protein